jgi:hypothetical protein
LGRKLQEFRGVGGRANSRENGAIVRGDFSFSLHLPRSAPENGVEPMNCADQKSKDLRQVVSTANVPEFVQEHRGQSRVSPVRRVFRQAHNFLPETPGYWSERSGGVRDAYFQSWTSADTGFSARNINKIGVEDRTMGPQRSQLYPGKNETTQEKQGSSEPCAQDDYVEPRKGPAVAIVCE